MSSILPDAVKLLPHFDADRLRQDATAVRNHYSNHANPAENYERDGDAGGWDIMPLRCPGGAVQRMGHGDGGMEDFADTPYMKLTPYIREILDELDIPVRGVRFSSLAAGATVGVHSDRPYGLPVGWARLHAPVVTNDQAVLTINGTDHRWKPGEFWYANFGAPHSLYNKGDEARIHLIIDCYISPEVCDLFPEEARKCIDEKEVGYFQEEQPLPDDLSGLAGVIRMPPSFLHGHYDMPSAQDWRARGKANRKGELRVQDGRLVLRIEGHDTALAHLGNGEFRPLCWTGEQTLSIESRGDTRWIEFRYRRGSYLVTTSRKQPELLA